LFFFLACLLVSSLARKKEKFGKRCAFFLDQAFKRSVRKGFAENKRRQKTEEVAPD